MASGFFSLKTLVLMEIPKLLWNAIFKVEDLILSNVKYDTERKWEYQLTSYRNESVCNLNALIKEGKIYTEFKSTLEENIFAIYYNYHNLCLWKMTYDPYNRINLLENNELYMPHYFKMDSEFYDKLWVERFVSNENYDILVRFNMACCFCLEIEIETLWSELKIIYNIDLGHFNFFSFFKDNLPLVSYMILKVEYDIETYEEDFENPEHFWMHAFEYAIEKGYEDAVYYLWQILPDFKKPNLVEYNRYFELISSGIEFPKDYISYFLFSQLSEYRKRELLRWTIENIRVEIWYVLLFSFNSRNTCMEGKRFYQQLTVGMLPPLFTLLTEKLRRQQIPFDIQIFQALWVDLRPGVKGYILENCPDLMENLAEGKCINCLGCIVTNLNNEQKLECLFYNRYKAGNFLFDIFCKNKEFDMFEKYLTFFLINTYSKHTVIFNRLRSDAKIFLNTYLNSPSFKALSEKESFKTNETKLKVRIDCLQTSLTLLNDLSLHVVNDADSNYNQNI